MSIRTLVVSLIVLIQGLLFLPSSVQSETFRRSWPTMGTYAEFESNHDSSDLNRRAEQAVRDVFERVNRTMSVYEPTSDISLLNQRAGMNEVRVDPWVVDVLEKGKRASWITDQAFSMDVLGYGVKFGLKPGGDSYALPPAGDRFIRIDRSINEVYLARPGMGLDLGGIAKGYALDRAVDALNDLGLNRFFLSLGRGIYAGASPADKKGWPVKIPGRPEPDYFERIFISVSEQGIRSDTGHVVNPRTGQPVPNKRQVVVTSHRGWIADVASTALMVDPDLRTTLLRQYSSLIELIVRRK